MGFFHAHFPDGNAHYDSTLVYPGLEDEIYRSTRSEIKGNSPEELCKRIIKDYSRMNHRRHGSTVAEVYELYLDWKYGENAAKQLSSDSRAATEAAFELLRPYHSRLLDDVTIQEWQDRVNKIGKQYSRSTVRNVVGLIKNLYWYAVPRELCRKDFGRYVVMPKTKPEVHHSLLRMRNWRSCGVSGRIRL